MKGEGKLDSILADGQRARNRRGAPKLPLEGEYSAGHQWRAIGGMNGFPGF